MESASLAVTVLYSTESTKGLAIPLFVEVYNIHVRFFLLLVLIPSWFCFDAKPEPGMRLQDTHVVFLMFEFEILWL